MIGKVLGRIYIGLVLVLLYAPIMVLILLSFNNSRSRVVWNGFTLNWYRSLFENDAIMNAFGTTIGLAAASALIASIIGLFAAIGMYAMRKKDYKTFMFFTDIPLLNADIVTGIALMLWMVRFMPLGFSSVLLSHITFNIPYVILSILPKLETTDIRQFEAARDLGAGNLYAFVKVVLPDLMPGILAGFFLSATMSMDDFVITYFTKGPGVNTLSTLIYGEIRKGIKPEMYALSSILFLMVLIILIIANHSAKENNGYEK
ncbi:MAG: ABC transporter permease [Lachnospiraceae bacterium]|nr:ABC transporter permease [Lachnospiraceae bacterium]